MVEDPRGSSSPRAGPSLLGEIGDLGLELQGKLLRPLQDGEFEPVGSSPTCKVDARVLAATNRDLANVIRGGRFREDLSCRLNAFPLCLPPLRESGDVVVRIAESELGRHPATLSDADAARLTACARPGHVRASRAR